MLHKFKLWMKLSFFVKEKKKKKGGKFFFFILLKYIKNRSDFSIVKNPFFYLS